jgi:hypothetical protein
VAASAGDFAQRLSDNFPLCVGRCGFYDLGHCVVLLEVDVFITRNLRWIASFCANAEDMKAEIRHFPARPLTPEERALVAAWIAGAGDIAEAYVSSRRSDDAALYHKIVVIIDAEDEPGHLIHAPSGQDTWIVFSIGRRTGIEHFGTLRAALNSVRPVLVDATPASSVTC